MIKKLLIVSLLTSITTMALNAKTCTKNWSDGESTIYTTTSNNCDKTYRIKETAKYKNGKVRYISNYSNNVANGIQKHFYKNGKLQSILTMSNGKREGELKRYYKNGQLASEDFYKNGEALGTFKIYNQKGKIVGETVYEYGKEKSKKYYYDNGNIKEEVSYLYNGRSIKKYFPNGKIKYTATYKGNYIDGPEQEYLENNTLIKDFSWANGHKSGLEVQIQKRRGYRNRQEIIYKNDDVISVKKFSNNLISTENTFKNGKWEKKYYSYNQDGKLTNIYSKTTKKTTYYNLDGSIDRVE